MIVLRSITEPALSAPTLKWRCLDSRFKIQGGYHRLKNITKKVHKQEKSLKMKRDVGMA